MSRPSEAGLVSVIDERGSLNLSSRSLDNKGLVQKLAVVDSNSLRSLVIANNTISKFPASVFSRVRSLDCTNNRLTTDGCYSLIAFPNVERLKIAGNPVAKIREHVYLLLNFLPKLRSVDGKDVSDVRLAVDSALGKQVKAVWTPYVKQLLGRKPAFGDFLELVKMHVVKNFSGDSLAEQFKATRFHRLAGGYFQEKVAASTAAVTARHGSSSESSSSPASVASSSLLVSPSSTRAVHIRLPRTVASPTFDVSTRGGRSCVATPTFSPRSSRLAGDDANMHTQRPTSVGVAVGNDNDDESVMGNENDSPVFERPSVEQSRAVTMQAQAELSALADDVATSSSDGGMTSSTSRQRRSSALPSSGLRTPGRKTPNTKTKSRSATPTSAAAAGVSSSSRGCKADLSSSLNGQDDPFDFEASTRAAAELPKLSPAKRAAVSPARNQGHGLRVTAATASSKTGRSPAARLALSPRRTRTSALRSTGRSPQPNTSGTDSGASAPTATTAAAAVATLSTATLDSTVGGRKRRLASSVSTSDAVPPAKRRRVAPDAGDKDFDVATGDRTTSSRIGSPPPVTADGWKCTRLLRCHADNNDPTEDETSVWSLAFPPSGSGDVFASAGGDSVCVINAKSGQVLKKFKVQKETFFNVLWTTTVIGDRKNEHLLLAAGSLGDVYILSTTYNVCFHVITSHSRAISSLVVLPSHPDILAGSAGRFVQLHHLGSVAESNSKLQMSSRRLCQLSCKTEVHQLSASADGTSLMAATDDSVDVWTFSTPWAATIQSMKGESQGCVLKRSSAVHRVLSIYPHDVIVDSAQFLSPSLFVSRPAPCHRDLKVTRIPSGKQKPQDCLQLQYPSTTDCDLRLTASWDTDESKHLVVAGHSQGALHCYHVADSPTQANKDPLSATWVLQGPPSAILASAVSSSYIVAGHSDNLVAIWERSR